MKFAPILLLNVVIVGIALVAYDQLRAHPQPAVSINTPSDDTEPLRLRIEALERAKQPLLRSRAPDARLAQRVEALEAALARRQATDAQAPAPTSPSTPASSGAWKDDKPSAEALAIFRRLRNAARYEDKAGLARKRIEGRLAKLDLDLSSEQRTAIYKANAAFAPDLTRIWTEVKTAMRETDANGGAPDQAAMVRSTYQRIQEEFAATLDGVVSSDDATSIAQALQGGRK